MALNNAKGGDFLKSDEWLAVAQEQALLIARPTSFREPTNEINGKPMKNTVEPVDADIVFVTGDRTNEVLRGANLIGRGMTGPLRRNGLGEDMAARAQIGKNGATQYVQFNPVSPTELEKLVSYIEAAKAAGFKDANGEGDPYSYAESLSGVTASDDDEPPF
jgi:hypothetical protein